MKYLKNIFTKYKVAGMVLLGFLAISCQSEFAKVIPEGKPEEPIDVVFGTPKVLLLVVDGARGQSVNQANTTVLKSLANQSIYSYASLSEEEATGIGNNWADIFTGVRKEKHKVLGNDFSNNDFSLYPLIFDRIIQKDENAKLKMISSSQQFLDNLGQHNAKELSTSDADVVAKIKTSLADNDVTMITGHFTAVEEAGQSSGFDNSYPEYKAAIENFDAQVGELLTAVSSRENYSSENWLIIVTSSQGGEFTIPEAENDNTIFSTPNVNTFTLFSALNYKQRFIGKPFIGNKIIGDFIRFNSKKYAQLSEGDNTIYDFGEGEFTVELKIKKNRGNGSFRFNYASILGKRDYWQTSWQNDRTVRGWVIYLEDDYWMFNGAGTGAINQVKGGNLSKGTWNTITAVGYFKDGKRWLKTFTDGNLNTDADISSWGNLNTNALLRVGWVPGNSDSWVSDVYLNDVRIWKEALSDDVIKSYSCEVGVDPRHPRLPMLVGNWFLANPDGRVILDESPQGGTLELNDNNYQINRLNDYICTPTIDELGRMVPRNPDVAAQIYSWLRIPRQSNWQLDGRVWLDK